LEWIIENNKLRNSIFSILNSEDFDQEERKSFFLNFAEIFVYLESVEDLWKIDSEVARSIVESGESFSDRCISSCLYSTTNFSYEVRNLVDMYILKL
jgi:glutaminase